MALPNFNDLSPAVQAVVILVVGVIVWGGTGYLYLRPLKAANVEKQTQVETLTAEIAPLRPYRERLRALEVDNQQLENQLANLQRIVPNEKEVDNFVRLLQAEAATAGVLVRRFTAKPAVTQQYYIEIPFELELDGSFYDVMQFYNRLGLVERITNVTDLQMGGIQSGRGGQRRYDYSPNETVVAICTVSTFFSREIDLEAEEAAAAGTAAAGA